jgi:hypothetical protein
MRLDNLKVTGDTLAQYLTDQGFRVTVHNTAINSLRMWLALAGVFPPDGWQVSQARVDDLLGLAPKQVAALASLTPEQLAFVEALCRINPEGRKFWAVPSGKTLYPRLYSNHYDKPASSITRQKARGAASRRCSGLSLRSSATFCRRLSDER